MSVWTIASIPFWCLGSIIFALAGGSVVVLHKEMRERRLKDARDSVIAILGLLTASGGILYIAAKVAS